MEQKKVESDKGQIIYAYGLKTRTWCFNESLQKFGCAECCTGDRCDEDCKAVYKGRRSECPHCKGKGWIPRADVEKVESLPENCEDPLASVGDCVFPAGTCQKCKVESPDVPKYNIEDVPKYDENGISIATTDEKVMWLMRKELAELRAELESAQSAAVKMMDYANDLRAERDELKEENAYSEKVHESKLQHYEQLHNQLADKNTKLEAENERLKEELKKWKKSAFDNMADGDL